MLAVITSAALALAACGAAESSSDKGGAAGDASLPAVTVDLGGDAKARYEKDEPFKIVFFNFGSGFVYTDAITKGAQERAKKLGIEMDVLDAAVDPTKQVQQIQDALQSKKYGGAFVLPIAESLLCDLLTKQAPKANLMTVVTNAPLCDRRTLNGNETRAPGTLAFVGGTQYVDTFTAWGEKIRADNPGKQKVIALVGPQQNAQSENAVAALKAIQKANPDFEVVSSIYTTFQGPDALKKVQDALQAHPDTTVVASIYSEITKAGVTAIKQAGKADQIKVYDVGADSTVLPLIKSGAVQMTYPYYPKTMGATAVQALYDARMGKKVQPTFENDGHAVEKQRGDAPLLFVTKDNLQEFIDSGLSEY